jgi:DNA-binding NarL/FixJ family response regulator
MTLKLLIIADNTKILRFVLYLILDRSNDLSIREEAVNGDELLKEIAVNQYNTLLLDLVMQGKDSVAMLKEVKSKWPHIPLMIFTIDPGDVQSAKMIRSGAFAYLNRKANLGNIISILRSIGKSKKILFHFQANMLADMLVFLENPVLIAHEQTIGRKLQNIIQPSIILKKSETLGTIRPFSYAFPLYQDHILTKLNFN